jgi:hypothetical protein
MAQENSFSFHLLPVAIELEGKQNVWEKPAR